VRAADIVIDSLYSTFIDSSPLLLIFRLKSITIARTHLQVALQVRTCPPKDSTYSIMIPLISNRVTSRGSLKMMRMILCRTMMRTRWRTMKTKWMMARIMMKKKMRILKIANSNKNLKANSKRMPRVWNRQVARKAKQSERSEILYN
jgi:hypothetical protein